MLFFYSDCSQSNELNDLIIGQTIVQSKRQLEAIWSKQQWLNVSGI